MKRLPLTDKHSAKLLEYGLQNMPPESFTCMIFQPGEMVLQEGLPIDWLAIVVNGKAKICSTAPNGKDLILCYYVSQGMAGDMEFMANVETATASMVAISEFECIVFPYRKYEKALKRNTVFLNRMGSELAKKLVQSSNNFVAASLYSGEERLCSYILNTSYHNMFSDVLTDVSCSIGISYRHLFRLLGLLCDEGVLEKRETGYRIINRKSLADRAGEACRSML